MTYIDGTKAMQLIDRAVGVKGEDYLYPIDAEGACKYVSSADRETPLCIVGHALRSR